ncbi:MAG: Ldh family oxidoreductase [Candidatus Methanodesulfokora sp.]|jgi:LDH2 family malate/lactate/ureidoglycolate dehydrogenase
MLYEKHVPDEEYTRVGYRDLKSFVKEVFLRLGVPEEDAEITADNLVAADLRGIESHGVSRLKRYVDGIKNGVVKTRPNVKVLKESPSTALVDGDFGLGQPIAYKAMRIAMEKAKNNCIGAVGVRNSNHYGIAGYYAMMALPDMIGISLTNSRPLAAHTHAVGRSIGTNPIAIAVPCKQEPHFVLDMATSTAPIGKIEVASRKGVKIPEGWAIDEEGNITVDPDYVLKRGALVPLGGLGEEMGGHKGYGLSVAVDVLSGVLTGAAWGPFVGATEGPAPANVGHFFIAINIDCFIPVDEFRERMELLKMTLKNWKVHPKAERIWIPGEKSWLTERTRKEIGVPLHRRTIEMLRKIGEELGIRFPI